MNTENRCYRVNCRLTGKVIQLHNDGFESDFALNDRGELVCAQDNKIFTTTEVEVCVVDQVFDFISHSYKYIHTVETTCGIRGLLVIEGIYACECKRRYIQVAEAILRSA